MQAASAEGNSSHMISLDGQLQKRLLASTPKTAMNNADQNPARSESDNLLVSTPPSDSEGKNHIIT